MKIEAKLINEIITSFYEVAIKDILIGYHFRSIEDFDTHIPRISDFWNLQLNGKLTDRSHLPFKLLEVHVPLKINRGEIFRWKKLFESTLNQYVKDKKLTKTQKDLWLSKVDLFSSRIESHLFK